MNEKRIVRSHVEPRIIIHGGAGHITRANLPPKSYHAYKASLLKVLKAEEESLNALNATALDVAVHAVSLLEDDPLFNCGKGAVFTRTGTNELEASVMVSNGHRKRGVGCMLLKHVKNPIKLAREMLIRGEEDVGGGAGSHSQLSGEELEKLAGVWGLEMVDPSYFFTQRRWDEHLRGLEEEKHAIPDLLMDDAPPTYMNTFESGVPRWDGKEYLPQGTVGAVVLDRYGTICAATSTGGLTNKLPGRIGDTPTLGAGFWAEEWRDSAHRPGTSAQINASGLNLLSRGKLANCMALCMSSLFSQSDSTRSAPAYSDRELRHAVGLSGTGNGDSFLRTAAARTAAAMSRFGHKNLAEAVEAVAGPDGELQKSAGDRWGKTGEGEGGIIGIELVGDHGLIVQDHNCGGMFRAWIDDAGKHRFMVFQDD